MLCRACIPRGGIARTFTVSALTLASTIALRHTRSLASGSRGWLQLSQQSSSQNAREALRTRSFSSTPQCQAQEDPTLQHTFAEQQKLLKLFQEKPEVLEDMKRFINVVREQGVDLQSGEMPKKADLFRLMLKEEVRSSAMKMMQVFQEAGIDLRSKEMMQSLMSMQDMLKGK